MYRKHPSLKKSASKVAIFALFVRFDKSGSDLHLKQWILYVTVVARHLQDIYNKNQGISYHL